MSMDEGKIKKLISQLGQLIGLKAQEDNNDPDGDSKKTNNTKGGEKNMDKIKELVNGLISNETTKFTEDDREFLEGLKECQLTKLEPVVNEVKRPCDSAVAKLISNESSPFDEKDKDTLSGMSEDQFKALSEKYPEKKDVEIKVNISTDTKPKTAEEFIEDAPEEVKEMLANGLKLQKEQKGLVIKELTANKRCRFTEDQLKAKSLDELKTLADLAQVEVDFSGNGIAPTVNVDDGEVLEIPVMNFQEN